MTMESFHPFRSATAREQYLEIYKMREKEWPVTSETRLVDTSFGRTFVRVSGAQDALPVVLLPGANCNSLMWVLSIKALSAHFRTIAR